MDFLYLITYFLIPKPDFISLHSSLPFSERKFLDIQELIFSNNFNIFSKISYYAELRF